MVGLMLEDGRYDTMVIDVHEASAPEGHIRLELAVAAGPRRGDVVAVRAALDSQTALDLLGLPMVLTVAEGRPLLSMERDGKMVSMSEPTDQPVPAADGEEAAAGAPQPVPVNMYEAQHALVIVAPLPGVMADDVEVTVEGRTVTIAAAMRTSAKKDYLLHEWHYGPYERQVSIPEGFGGKAEATFANGQLALRVTRGEDLGELRVVAPSAPKT